MTVRLLEIMHIPVIPHKCIVEDNRYNGIEGGDLQTGEIWQSHVHLITFF